MDTCPHLIRRPRHPGVLAGEIYECRLPSCSCPATYCRLKSDAELMQIMIDHVRQGRPLRLSDLEDII